MSFRANRRPSAVLAPCLGLAFAAIGAIGPPDASAGTYVVRRCDAADLRREGSVRSGGVEPGARAWERPTRRREATEKALTVDALEQADLGRYGLWRFEAPPDLS